MQCYLDQTLLFRDPEIQIRGNLLDCKYFVII